MTDLVYMFGKMSVGMAEMQRDDSSPVLEGMDVV